MSLISEQVKHLRGYAEFYMVCGDTEFANEIYKAADTIESLSAKLAAQNMERSTAYYNSGWIPCKERMPVLNVEDKSVDRKQSFERDGYLFPFDIGKEFLVTDKYGHVHPSTFWLIEKAFDDVNAIAWMEKPEPWKGE